MIVVTPAGTIALGTVEAAPTVGIIDYSRRVTDDFGITTVVERGFARRMSVRLAIASDQVDAVQAQLARLRASVVTWIADDRFNSLSFQGFLKEFEIDLPGTQISYCSLVVESLVEPPAPAEGGGDPAPAGQASSLHLILPMAVTDANLQAASVPEADHPVWSAGAIYSVGARVILPATHRIYESIAEGNSGDDPAGLSGKWIDVAPTNRWAMFDQALGTATTAAGVIEVTINAGTANAIALLDLIGTTVRVVAAGYDRTVPIGAGAVTFFDLPGGAVTVMIAGDQVACGTLLVGRLMALGITEAGAGAGITDYSRKVVDDFGEVTLVERAYAKRMTAKALIRTDAVDLVASRIAAVRARPSLWIGQAGVDSLTVYGLFRDFSIEVGETVSRLSLSIEGLSKAAPLADPNAPIHAVIARLADLRADVDAIASDGVITAGREKGRLVQDYLVLINWLSAIEARFAALGSPADIADARIAALAARAVLDELLLSYLPAWNDLTTDTVINSGQLRATWVSTEQAIATYAAAVTGRKGEPGQNAPLVRVQWSINGVDGWHDHFFGADAFQRQSNDDGATWGPAYRVVGEAGMVGPDGTSPSIVFRRSPDQPAAPGDNTGNPPAGWSDGPPQGTEILWQSKATFRGATQLTSWSVPVRISGKDGASAPLVRTQWSINGVDGWHDNFFGADAYQRQSNDNGATWGPAYRVVGEAGTIGLDGTSPSIVFSRSATVPGAPADNSGNPPAGWSDGPPAGTEYLWQSKATFRGATQLTSWSAPQRISGEKGDPGDKGDKGDKGDGGAAGRDAIVFQQDATPSNPVVGDTWVTVTAPRVWRKWNGSSWVQILGNVSAVDLIDEAYIADLSVGTAKMKNLSVETIKIAGQAVSTTTFTKIEAAYSVGQDTGFNEWVNIIQHQLGFDGDEIALVSPSIVFVFDDYGGTGTAGENNSVRVRMLRDGSVIWGPAILPNTLTQSGSGVNFRRTSGVLGFTLNDQPGAGQHIYTLQFTKDSVIAPGQISNRLITAAKLKR